MKLVNIDNMMLDRLYSDSFMTLNEKINDVNRGMKAACYPPDPNRHPYEHETHFYSDEKRRKKFMERNTRAVKTKQDIFNTLNEEQKNLVYVMVGTAIKDMGSAVYNSLFIDEMSIRNVIFNDPATIVYWSDETRTVVKVENGERFDPEKGLAMAITKKVLGNTGRYYNLFKKWLPKEEENA